MATSRVVYCVVTEANPDIMSWRHDTYLSRHYAGCRLYPDELEFYRIFLCNYITPIRTRRIYDVHVWCHVSKVEVKWEKNY